MKLLSYAKAYRVLLVPSVVIPDKWHNKIQICFHGNASLGLCQCEKDDWRSIQKGLWSSVMSPYEQRFVDVKFGGGVSGSVTITLDEVCHRDGATSCLRLDLLYFSWHPLTVVSQWVPFYYTSSMAIGVLAVVLILLYQVYWETIELFDCTGFEYGRGLLSESRGALDRPFGVVRLLHYPGEMGFLMRLYMVLLHTQIRE